MKVIISEAQYHNILLQEATWWDTAKELGEKLFNKVSNYFNELEFGQIKSLKPKFVEIAGISEYKKLFKNLSQRKISKKEFMDRLKNPHKYYKSQMKQVAGINFTPVDDEGVDKILNNLSRHRFRNWWAASPSDAFPEAWINSSLPLKVKDGTTGEIKTIHVVAQSVGMDRGGLSSVGSFVVDHNLLILNPTAIKKFSDKESMENEFKHVLRHEITHVKQPSRKSPVLHSTYLMHAAPDLKGKDNPVASFLSRFPDDVVDRAIAFAKNKELIDKINSGYKAIEGKSFVDGSRGADDIAASILGYTLHQWETEAFFTPLLKILVEMGKNEKYYPFLNWLDDFLRGMDMDKMNQDLIRFEKEFPEILDRTILGTILKLRIMDEVYPQKYRNYASDLYTQLQHLKNEIKKKKSVNETLIHEDTQSDYIQKVVQHLLKDSKGGAPTPSHAAIIQNYGLQPFDVEYLNHLEEEALERIKGVLFNVSDYSESVGIGGYDFKFVVRGLYGEKYLGAEWTLEKERGDRFPQVNWVVEAVVLLRGGSVELMGTGEEIKLETAIDNPDYGWEIESEIGELIRDIIYAEEPILKAVGAFVAVDQSYE